MKKRKRIEILEKEILELKKVVKKDSITLTDESNPNQVVTMSYKNGAFSTDKITTEVVTQTENISNEQKN
ncbi:hypothetical protein [Flavobacterium laiguense]|uniref:Uncharacterized protein n=1 Tax=Flavobacterium laiguense TaxID=2169409 RepID=A0A2U1K156_9FLAO|nr:hypothetical protein [Flavobacterium laiguense]PWA10985.1 hypothetical protein DB891_03900 [Flavobacterium laiguense]